MNRARALEALRGEDFDVLVIGGGATGLGCAVDAASRGYRTALIEAEDFAKATSSRSTKLVHGGVRYLRQGNLALVREALLERSRLRANAPALVRELPFLVPAYRWLDWPYYAAGLKIYDGLAGACGFPRSRIAGAGYARRRIPNLNAAGLCGGVLYWDAQFDDAQLAVALARTASNVGASVANYAGAEAFLYEDGAVCGVTARDRETQERFEIRARTVINATGIFVDALRRMDDPAAAPLLTYSRGSHVVVDAQALGGAQTALLVPKTSDGRVLFAIPWHGNTLIGTTEIVADKPEWEPQPTSAEIDYMLATVNAYLDRKVSRAQIRTAFAGLRPLIDRKAASTSRLSREHLISISRSGLVTVAGGKWTTYRRMAEDAVDAAERQAGFPHAPSPTAELRLLTAPASPRPRGFEERVRHAASEEMARTVEDVLARRMQTLFIDARSALEQAPAVASILAKTLERDGDWERDQVRSFTELARRYIPPQ